MSKVEILVVPSGEVGDKIIKAFKDAGYKIKKPKPKKLKITTGNGIINQINKYYPIGQREKVEQDGDDERRNAIR